jgi:hypothetical protein
VPMARARMVSVGMGYDGSVHGARRIDVEIARLAEYPVAGGHDDIFGSHNLEIGMKRPSGRAAGVPTPSIASEYDRGKPSGGERHAYGGKPVENPVLACRCGDDLLYAIFGHFERCRRARNLRPLGK